MKYYARLPINSLAHNLTFDFNRSTSQNDKQCHLKFSYSKFIDNSLFDNFISTEILPLGEILARGQGLWFGLCCVLPPSVVLHDASGPVARSVWNAWSSITSCLEVICLNAVVTGHHHKQRKATLYSKYCLLDARGGVHETAFTWRSSTSVQCERRSTCEH